MKAKTIYITVQLDDASKSIDWPQDTPLPRINETVIISDYGAGQVYDVRHVLVYDTLTINIKIKAT